MEPPVDADADDGPAVRRIRKQPATLERDPDHERAGTGASRRMTSRARNSSRIEATDQDERELIADGYRGPIEGGATGPARGSRCGEPRRPGLDCGRRMTTRSNARKDTARRAVAEAKRRHRGRRRTGPAESALWSGCRRATWPSRPWWSSGTWRGPSAPCRRRATRPFSTIRDAGEERPPCVVLHLTRHASARRQAKSSAGSS